AFFKVGCWGSRWGAPDVYPTTVVTGYSAAGRMNQATTILTCTDLVAAALAAGCGLSVALTLAMTLAGCRASRIR
ncbi:MAG: hypothetical protein Q4B17_08850, partial [Lautropia sp.]|nr:hypothetical protein [Lautropia sp.]